MPPDDITRLREEIRRMQLCLERKNRALDALHWVWCDGGCDTGTHRWTPQTVTEDVVVEAEQHAQRLRTWWSNYQYRRKGKP